jgi:hypothetical protein
MCPSTEPTDAQRQFAADVVRNLLRYIDAENAKGCDPYLVSHAWTDGAMMYLVYKAPPSDITWGLARDTRRSVIDPDSWPDMDEAVLYYYLIDLEEGRMSASFRHPGDPDTILWRGFPREGLPVRPSDIPDAYRYTPPPGASPPTRSRDQRRSVNTPPRLYTDPF